MSGDVQPRKRKDKKKAKRDDEEVKESHHGVHAEKLGKDDVLLHVQGDHETGGHWCAKLFFFSLMAILVGIVGLIILENRGSSDVDTPLSESRFSEYFEGWVDEHRQAHDDHHSPSPGLDDHDGEPFEEEEDHSEAADEDHDVADDHDEDDGDDQEDEAVGGDDNEDENEETVDESNADENEDDDDVEPEVDRVEMSSQNARNKREVEIDDNDEGFEEGGDDNDDVDEENDDSAPNDDDHNDENNPDEEDDDDAPFEEDDDDFDDADESLEKVIDNDAGEELHLRRKAEQEELAARAAAAVEEESESAPQVRGPQTYLDDDSYIDEEIRRANEELFNDNLKSALHIYETLTFKFPEHPGALNGKAKVLDRLSTKYHSNEFLNEAIKAYQAVMNLGDKVNDEIFREAGEKCLERMRFRGMLAQAVPIHRKMIRRFSDDPAVRNQLAVTYLLQNRYEEAKYILHHTLMRWRGDGFAQAHYGFILKVHNNDLKAAVSLLREGIASGANGTQDGRFYFALGDALTRLGETKEALEVYQKGADLKLFPSVYQRSLYNIDGLKAQPFWTPEESTYEKEFSILQRNWELIQKEGLTALNVQGLYMDEAESLRDKGDWKQLELFARGYRIEKNCAKTPLTCNMIETFPAARMCKRGQVKFSIIHPGTHVWPHCGPTNCRLRGHLGLVVPSGTKLRVAKEERTWKAGEWLIFDDSFEHEVWHNGTSPRLVLIVDVWHPELTETQRDSLSRI